MEGPIDPAFVAHSIAKHSTRTDIGAHEIFLGQVFRVPHLAVDIEQQGTQSRIASVVEIRRGASDELQRGRVERSLHVCIRFALHVVLMAIGESIGIAMAVGTTSAL